MLRVLIESEGKVLKDVSIVVRRSIECEREGPVQVRSVRWRTSVRLIGWERQG